MVTAEDYPGPRNASTAIYALIEGVQLSSLHKTRSTQTMHFYRGNTDMLVHEITPEGTLKHYVLGVGEAEDETWTLRLEIPAGGSWFCFELKDKEADKFVLSGHTVAPGFEFEDFKLADRETMIKIYEDPTVREFIIRFTPDPESVHTTAATTSTIAINKASAQSAVGSCGRK